MVAAKSKRQLAQVIPFGLISMVFGLVYALLEQGILGDHPSYPSTGNPYHFSPVSSALFSFIAGLIIGTLEVVFLNRRFQRSSFLKKIIYKTIVYMLLITAFTWLLSIFGHAYEMGRSPWDKEVLQFATTFFTSFAFWTIELYMAIGVSIALFYTEISDNIGQRVLLNFFTGRYHHPIEEDRVFMFLDMKDSTTIAEKLGHVKYFSMLREYYADLTDPIINAGGEIYQYVGDEVIVTWQQNEGKVTDQCFQCFFAMKSALQAQAQKYQVGYGVVPSFKAGIHLGSVTTGEIGVIKKEITFSGDVLNTTARIQGLCNKYELDLLISEQLLQAMDIGGEFRARAIGEVELRGRNEKINLHTVERI